MCCCLVAAFSDCRPRSGEALQPAGEGRLARTFSQHSRPPDDRRPCIGVGQPRRQGRASWCGAREVQSPDSCEAGSGRYILHAGQSDAAAHHSGHDVIACHTAAHKTCCMGYQCHIQSKGNGVQLNWPCMCGTHRRRRSSRSITPPLGHVPRITARGSLEPITPRPPVARLSLEDGKRHRRHHYRNPPPTTPPSKAVAPIHPQPQLRPASFATSALCCCPQPSSS